MSQPADLPEQTRAPYRPPAGMPLEREGRWGWPVSILLHALVIGLLLVPAVATGLIPSPLATGAGGPGPAGGGGGGTAGPGTKGILPERLRFLHVPPPAPPVEQPAPAVTPPVPPPVEQPKAEPEPEQAKISEAVPPRIDDVSVGEGGGTGNDGTDGSGPGRGGGVGSGDGTGRGSGVGPGTGGGDGTIYPPRPTHVFLPPLPAPKNVAGHTLVAVFDVDSTGKVLSVEFTPTRDRAYNAKLKDMLHEIRFKPAVRPDGSPIRARAEIKYEL